MGKLSWVRSHTHNNTHNPINKCSTISNFLFLFFFIFESKLGGGGGTKLGMHFYDPARLPPTFFVCFPPPNLSVWVCRRTRKEIGSPFASSSGKIRVALIRFLWGCCQLSRTFFSFFSLLRWGTTKIQIYVFWKGKKWTCTRFPIRVWCSFVQ